MKNISGSNLGRQPFFSEFRRGLGALLVAGLGSVMVLSLAGCTFKKAELGTADNPVKLFFTPSVDAKVIEDNSKTFKEYLEKATPYKFEVSVPQSFVAVVEAFGTKRADIAAMNTFGYIMANERFGAQAKLTVLRDGRGTYQSQIIVRADSPVQKISELKGKKVAFVDAASTSGYLLPMKKLKDSDAEPKEPVFANKHDNVVTMVYQGQVDAGATFYSPANDEGIQDARRLVKTQFPDVEKKIRILDLSDAIPNDPIVFRKDMPEEMKTNIVNAFVEFVKTPEGKDAFKKIYGVTDLKTATDEDYNAVRDVLKALGRNVNELVK